MHLTDFLSAQLEREIDRSRRALARVPEGRGDWKPHPKSMALGYLSTLVATMPDWIAMMIERDELDLNPPGGGGYKPLAPTNNQELLAAHDAAAERARKALRGTDDAHLLTRWKLLVAGHVVAEDPRHAAIGDTFTHLAHHRGQLTVYLRLNDAPVPALFGPSADDRSFG